MSEHYITSSELLALAAWWFAPPLVIALLLQVFLYRKWAPLRHKPAIALTGMFGVIVVSPVLGFFGLASGVPIPRWLGAKGDMLFLPMAYVIVGFVMALVLLATYGYHRCVPRS